MLPKPFVGVNRSGRHTSVSINKGETNLFWDPKGQEELSRSGIYTHGNDICLGLNPSLNSYRRLDPHFEAPWLASEHALQMEVGVPLSWWGSEHGQDA